MVYDLIEPYGPRVDGEALEVTRSTVFTPRNFVIGAKGVCKLHPELAQALVSVLGGLKSLGDDPPQRPGPVLRKAATVGPARLTG